MADGTCSAFKIDWCPCPSFKIIFYILDIGTDIYNTIQFFLDCHFHIAAFSLFFIILPNIVCGIAASLKNRNFKSFIIPCLLLQLFTLVELTKATDGFPGTKVLEVLFEAVPQFVIQMYAMFLYGFGFSSTGSILGVQNNIINPGFKIFGIITSAIAIFHGVNSFIVDENFTSYNWRYIFKSSLYTILDITARLLFYPVAWILLPGYAILFNVVLLLLWSFVYKALLPETEKVDILVYSLGINVCPQIAAPFKKSKIAAPFKDSEEESNQPVEKIDPVGKMWILAKVFANMSFFFFTIFLHFCLEIDVTNTVIDTMRLQAELPENFTISICDNPGEYQEVTFIHTDHLKIFIYVIYVCIFVSSIEIFLYYFCHTRWNAWIIGSGKRHRVNDKDKIVQLKVVPCSSSIQLPSWLCEFKKDYEEEDEDVQGRLLLERNQTDKCTMVDNQAVVTEQPNGSGENAAN